ncbi:hypothetical protein CDAR_510411 [Caerostris darwini]|uniref:Uncharacterized protein n=1 Tax=Caerostris darwini TaxID=1538125 RepID=A0AAV4UXI8_9ARAC|nr:hypothetical protein CDAR_510411 [Caerostris darwini]
MKLSNLRKINSSPYTSCTFPYTPLTLKVNLNEIKDFHSTAKPTKIETESDQGFQIINKKHTIKCYIGLANSDSFEILTTEKFEIQNVDENSETSDQIKP